MKKNKLVIGSAGKSEPDAITLDLDPKHKPDVVHDLQVAPFPFENDQFDSIVAHHVLEHLDDISTTMQELYRICKPSGTIHIEVPHHTSWCANIPFHKLRFNYFSFDVYTNKVMWKTDLEFKLIRQELTFHRAHRRFFLHKLFNRFPMAYERFWTYIFPAENFKIWLQPIKKEQNA